MSARALPELDSAVSSDEFQALEEKVYKTIELLKSAREARAMAERDVVRLREQLEEREEEVETMREKMVGLRREREEEVETMREKMVGLRREREDVRSRVEKMLKQLDVMGAEAS